MLDAFLWGILATSSLVVGGAIALKFSLSNRTIGIIMGFGAGTLISAVSYELIFEAIKLGKGTAYPVFGFFTGAFTYYFGDMLIGKIGSKKTKTANTFQSSNLVIPMVLGIILDGIPESIVIGLGIFKARSIGLAIFVAVFISNLPEAIAGTTGMKEDGWSNKSILLLWTFIAIVCALATVAGYALFSSTSPHWLSFIQAFAGGAILMMLANSMIPEAYEHGGKLAGVFTVLGFFISVTIVIMENF